MILQDYIKLFPGSTREKSRFMAMAIAVLQQVIDLFTLTNQLSSAFALNDAVGKQLDMIGSYWNLSRAECINSGYTTDEEFRLYLFLKLLQWQWDGTNAGADEYVSKASVLTRQTDNMNASVSDVLNGTLPAAAKSVLPVPFGISASVS